MSVEKNGMVNMVYRGEKKLLLHFVMKMFCTLIFVALYKLLHMIHIHIFMIQQQYR